MQKSVISTSASIIFAAVLFLAGCSGPAAQPAPTSPPPPPPSTETIPPTNPPLPTNTPLPPTPTSTPTATPIPYALTVKVIDDKNQAVKYASLTMAELGDNDGATQNVDENGQVSWNDLPSDTASIAVKAPGYKAMEKSMTLQRGPNELVLPLELDPFGLLPDKACNPDEKMLYVADFQDNQAPGWPEIEAGSQGWTIGSDPAEEGNIVLIAQGSPENMTSGVDLRNFTFENAVWRASIKYDGGPRIFSFFNWRHSWDAGDMRYFVNTGPGVMIDMTRFNSGEGIAMGVSGAQMTKNKWARLEISTFDGKTEVWFNGKKALSFTDKNPIPPGTIGLEPHFNNGTGSFYYDNFSVCELSAPFTSLAATDKK